MGLSADVANAGAITHSDISEREGRTEDLFRSRTRRTGQRVRSSETSYEWEKAPLLAYVTVPRCFLYSLMLISINRNSASFPTLQGSRTQTATGDGTPRDSGRTGNWTQKIGSTNVFMV